MSNRRKFWALFAVFMMLTLATFTWLFIEAYVAMPQVDSGTLSWFKHYSGFVVAAIFILLLILAQIWSWLEKSLIEPASKLERQTSIIANIASDHHIDIGSGHWFGELPDTVQKLGDSLSKTRREVREALATGAHGVERLEMVIKKLKTGIIVCDGEARILLYNSAVQDIFSGHNMGLGLDRSLYGLLTRLPVETTINHLLEEQNSSTAKKIEEASFYCSIAKSDILLDCTLALLPDHNINQSMFVMTLADVTRNMEALQRKDRLIRNSLDKFSSPMANIRAAAENLVSHPDIDVQTRDSFHKIISQEVATLSDLFYMASKEAQSIASGHWMLRDTNTSDLFLMLDRHLNKSGGPKVVMGGEPRWIQADATALLMALESVIFNIAQKSGCQTITIESLIGDALVYLDLTWSGEPIPAATVELWQKQAIIGGGDMTLGEVVERHGGAIWSQKHRCDGQSILRIPVPISTRQWQQPKEEIPERPEFYDFSRRDSTKELGRLAASSLSDLTFVVFDTETTGLNPSGGDEIISIAGVRIVNGRILTGEIFKELVDPGLPIPKSSTKIHGISNAMVAGAPGIDTVLPRFKEFTAGAVLVAHNAAFDMRFLQLKEESSGVWFDNPVLDTLLLSVYLHEDVIDHTLDGIAGRLGVEVQDRHTALGDAMVTAQAFLKLLKLLKNKGVTSLGLAIEASENMIQIRKQQEKARY
ncbi:MAG: 3'-5' exonuclease [Magnetococcales bacterium]|nr:3'-5' exonuclease [Magnetococcales bacterium]